MAQVRVAIAHEWLVSHGGSERCVEEMLALYPEARLLTTVLEPDAVPPVLRRAEPSFLQRLPGATRAHQWLLPLMPLSWRLRPPLTDVDVVISSNHACAKAVRVGAGIPHLCYCHTPMRYAWNFDSERSRLPRVLQPPARAGMGWFRRWDRETARRVTRFVANSSAVAGRIERAYGREADVVHPPVRTDFFTPGPRVSREDHFLFVARLVGYKQPELALQAFAGLPYRLLVVGDGAARAALEARAPANVEFLGTVDDDALRSLYRSARALVHPGEEDFGIAMAEAQACGTPVIGLAAGGAVDIVEHGRTGWLVEREDPELLREAVRVAAVEELDAEAIARRAQRFSAERFRTEIAAAVEAQLRRPARSAA
jgi:glycosyltransferase involved in cell wall biosynthesis